MDGAARSAVGDLPPIVADLAARVGRAEPRCGAVRLICVDGPAGSGKTTLAASLAERLDGCAVVHLDDLYEGWRQPLGAALSARIEAWLLCPWRSGLPGRHLRFDWGREQFVAWVEVPYAPVVVLEGCGSAARDVRSSASLVVWVEAPGDVARGRGLDRDGAHLAGHWDRWAAAEAAHFAADGTRAAADMVVLT